MLAEDEELEGNDRYIGFCMDLIFEVSKLLGFNYTVSLVADGSNGSKNKVTGEWNGMVRELLDHVSMIFILISCKSMSCEFNCINFQKCTNVGKSIL